MWSVEATTQEGHSESLSSSRNPLNVCVNVYFYMYDTTVYTHVFYLRLGSMFLHPQSALFSETLLPHVIQQPPHTSMYVNILC